MRNTVAVLLGMLVIASAVPAYCQDMAAEESTMEESMAAEIISGEVMSVDVVNVGISVAKPADPTTGAAETVNIKLSPNAEILKGGTAVTLADVMVGNKITVECSKDALGNTIASKVTLQ